MSRRLTLYRAEGVKSTPQKTSANNLKLAQAEGLRFSGLLANLDLYIQWRFPILILSRSNVMDLQLETYPARNRVKSTILVDISKNTHLRLYFYRFTIKIMAKT